MQASSFRWAEKRGVGLGKRDVGTILSREPQEGSSLAIKRGKDAGKRSEAAEEVPAYGKNFGFKHRWGINGGRATKNLSGLFRGTRHLLRSRVCMRSGETKGFLLEEKHFPLKKDRRRDSRSLQKGKARATLSRSEAQRKGRIGKVSKARREKPPGLVAHSYS